MIFVKRSADGDVDGVEEFGLSTRRRDLLTVPLRLGTSCQQVLHTGQNYKHLFIFALFLYDFRGKIAKVG
jgi:hypothetical protein